MSPRGFDNVPERGSSSFIPTIRLRDNGESCRLRFLTDYDDFFWERFHRRMKGREFQGFFVCENSAFNKPCAACSAGDKSIVLIHAWVYESVHDYTEPQEDTKAIKEGRRTVYRKTVNEPKLFRISVAHKGSIGLRIEKVGTLLEHDFDWVRSGKRGDVNTSYTLDFGEKLSEEDKEEMVKIAASLPSLEDAVLGKVTSLDTETSTTGYRKNYSVVSVSVDEDDEEVPF